MDMTFINFHGLWTDKKEGRGKQDIEERLEQSENILKFTSKLSNPYILCGDFNLLPDTESIKKFERAGLKNLIREYNITSTRTSYYTRPEKHADYAFVSDGIEVKDFKILPDKISDHAPMSLEFA
jgi:endonuclease/exonuclease/phosphatase family metal-dependent hydrolase